MLENVVRKCVKDKEKTAFFTFWLVLGLTVYSATVTALYLNAPTLLIVVVEIVATLVGTFLAAYIASYIYSLEGLAEAECRALFEARHREEKG